MRQAYESGGIVLAEVRRYDVVIVGLGPAGSSLAYLLRRKGLRVAGLDWVKSDRIWGKPCGDAIGAAHFDEAGLPHPREPALMQVVNGIDIYSPSEEVKIRLYQEGGGYMIDRTLYGLMLLDESKDSIDLYLRTHALAPIIEDGKLVGVRAKNHEDERIYEFRANVVVDATGSGGAIKRKLPKEWPVNEPLKKTDSAVAYRKIVELEYDIEEPDIIRIYINEEIAPGGYWWLFPKGRNIANIGLGVQNGRGFPHPARLYREKLMKREDVGREKRVITEAGALLPTRRPANTLVWDNFISIGDNGYTVNPLHGGGMGYAMVAARHAADAIEEAFDKGDFTSRTLWKANIGYMRTIGAKQASMDILRMYLQTLTNEEVEWAMKNGLATVEDLIETTTTGELKANLSILDKAGILVRLLGRPTMLLKMRILGRYMKQAKDLYLKYPESPGDLPRWVDQVETLYAEFKKAMNITW